MTSAAEVVRIAANRAWEPPVTLRLDEWADANRMLSQPEPGNYRVERTPYVRGIMECLSPAHPAKHIVWEKGSQVGATEVGVCWVGFKIAHDPAPMIITLPSQDVAKEWSTQRLTQLVEDTPALHGKLADNRRKSSGNATFLKKIKGTSATIKLAWATSAKKLRSTSAQDLMSDEVDGFTGDADGEGDPLWLLDRRNTNFPLGKHYKVSTPAEAPSRIHREFLKGDQRYYFVPCPFCGHYQVLVLDRLRWPKRVQGETAAQRLERYRQVHYDCIGCGAGIPERYKTQMLAAEMWVATADHPDLLKTGFAAADLSSLQPIFDAMNKAVFASFHLSAMYSPLGWYSWESLAADREASLNDAKALKVFVNTIKGEPWIEVGEVMDPQRLYDRREDYPVGIVPSGGLILIAGSDVQGDRIEFELAAFGPRGQRWSVWYEVIQPFRPNSRGEMVPCRTTDPEPWQRLAELMLQEWPLADGGTLPIRVLGIDARHNGEMVYEFARRFPQPNYGPNGIGIFTDRVVVPLAGGPGWQAAIESVSSVDAAKKRRGLRVVHVGTAYTKLAVYNALNKNAPRDGEPYPDGYYHFPDYDFGYFEGITAETRHVTEKGRVEWKNEGKRNEPLDIAGYIVAMSEALQVHKYQDAQWEICRRRIKQAPVISPDQPAPVMAGHTGRRMMGRMF